MEEKTDIMKDELELLKEVPNIIKAQKFVGDIKSRESLFFFGKCRLRNVWWYEAGAFFMAAIFDTLLIIAALSATILFWKWLQ